MSQTREQINDEVIRTHGLAVRWLGTSVIAAAVLCVPVAVGVGAGLEHKPGVAEVMAGVVTLDASLVTFSLFVANSADHRATALSALIAAHDLNASALPPNQP